MDNRLLRSTMVLHGDTINELARHLGIAHQTLSRKIQGKADFTQSEIVAIKARYRLDNETLAEMFFQGVEI